MDEAVFYFDVLGFSGMSAGSGVDAVDVLGDLIIVLHDTRIRDRMLKWTGRYSLGDSVFLTHSDPVEALRLSAELVFNIVCVRAQYPVPTAPDPILVRGALAYGNVQHVDGIFESQTNLVGSAVVEAVDLEKTECVKGPRVLLNDAFKNAVADGDPSLAEWLLRPTSIPGVWEVLWLLPPERSDLAANELFVANVCAAAVRLLETKGGHPTYGAHYRAFVLLAGRSIQRDSLSVDWRRSRRRHSTSSFRDERLLTFAIVLLGFPMGSLRKSSG
jgi:hypothetical protein